MRSGSVWREQCGRDGVSAVWYWSMLAARTALNRSVDWTLHPFSDAVAVACVSKTLDSSCGVEKSSSAWLS